MSRVTSDADLRRGVIVRRQSGSSIHNVWPVILKSIRATTRIDQDYYPENLARMYIGELPLTCAAATLLCRRHTPFFPHRHTSAHAHARAHSPGWGRIESKTCDATSNSLENGCSQVCTPGPPRARAPRFVVNAPGLFHVVWKMITPLLDPKTKAKISLFSGESAHLRALTEVLDVDHIPLFLGGDSRKDDGYWSGGYSRGVQHSSHLAMDEYIMHEKRLLGQPRIDQRCLLG